MTPKPFFGPKRFVGRVYQGDSAIKCGLSVEIDSGGHLKVELEHIPLTKESWFLFKAHESGTHFPLFSIEASSDDGDCLSSDKLFFTKPGTTSNIEGSFFVYSGQCGSATIKTKPGKNDKPGRVTWFLKGFRSFRPISITTKWGELSISGRETDNFSIMRGAFQLRSEDRELTYKGGYHNADDLLEHVLWIISFASGTFLKDPVRVYEHEDRNEIEVRNLTPAVKPILSPFSYLHLNGILDAAIEAYSSRRRECQEMRVTIEYLLLDANYTEARLITAAIALEHLVNNYLSQKEKIREEADSFAKKCDRLTSLIEAEFSSRDDARRVLASIKAVNNLSFGEKLSAFLSKWNISLEGLMPNVVQNLVNVRNAIAHGRMLKEEPKTKKLDQWSMYLNIREIIVRVILLRIGYVGNYECYVGGQHTRHFPSCRRA